MARFTLGNDIFIYAIMFLFPIILGPNKLNENPMKNYQTFFDQARELIQKDSPDIESILEKCSTQSGDNALFINCHTGGATYKGTTYGFNIGNPELLNYLLQKHQVKYLVVLDAVGESPLDKLLPSPQACEPQEEWNIHLWELYRDLYYAPDKQAFEKTRLRVVYCAMLFCRQDLFKVQYFNNTLVNIFGWLVCPGTGVLSDLYLDVFYCYSE